MSKVFQCDVCQRIGKQDEYGLPPKRWTQGQVQTVEGLTVFFDTCSPTCAIAYFREGKSNAKR